MHNFDSARSWRPSTLSFSCLLAGVFVWGAFLFFSNASIPELFIGGSGDIEWYAVFANEIFKPNSLYIAESILLPLFAKIVGASESLQAYRLVCALITMSILPAIAWSATMYFQSISKALVLTIVFSFTYKYLWAYQLGFPDPMTICLLVLLVLQTNRAIQLALVILAGLSHFSMTLVAVLSLCGCVVCLPLRSPEYRYRLFKVLLFGLIVSKLLLWAWGFVFRYHLDSRFSHAWQSGLPYFIDRYSANPVAFWLTPGWPQLFFTCFLFIYFLVRKRIAFALALLGSLCIAYFTLFVTTDGLRVFAVVIAPTYALALITLIEDVFVVYSQQIRRLVICCSDYWCHWKGGVLRLLYGLSFASLWWFLADRARHRGLLVNHGDFLSISVWNIGIYECLFFSMAVLIIFISLFPLAPVTRSLKYVLKCVLLMVLLLALVQFIRQQNQSWIDISSAKQVLLLFMIMLFSAQMAREKYELVVVGVVASIKRAIGDSLK